MTQAIITGTLLSVMGDGPTSSEKPPSGFKGWLKFRRSTEPGVDDVLVGEVNPKDPFYVQGAKDTGGVIVTGEEEEKGVGVFPISGSPKKPSEENPPEK